MEPFSPEHGVDRLRAVVAELRRLSAHEAALQVGTNATLTPSGELVDSERGVDVRLRLDGAEVELRLTHRSATVEAVSRPPGEAPGFCRIRDKLSIYLGRGYCWADVLYDTPGELAAALLWHMRERGQAARQAQPPAPAPVSPHPVPALTGTRALTTFDAGYHHRGRSSVG